MIRLMSYNIHHGANINDKLNLQEISNVINQTGADIVCIQEVDRFYGKRSNFKDQASELAEMLRYYYVYGANLIKEPLCNKVELRQYGNAILSRYPIIKCENFSLSDSEKEPRGLLWSLVNVGDVYLSFYNTHLDLDITTRIKQVKKVIKIISDDKYLKILSGDFNTTPHNKDMQLLLDHTEFKDSFKNIKNASTFPVGNPNKRIDYILTSKQIVCKNQQVIETMASDHLPILTDIEIAQ